MRDVRRYLPQITLLLLGLIAFILPLGLTPLFDLDEGAFSEATREMLHGGDYITTYLNGNLRFDKPILIYWLQLASVKLFGLNEFAVRLPSALAASFWVWLTYRFTRMVWDRERAFYAALFMLAALQINLIAKAAIADGLLNLWIAATMFALYRYYDTGRGRDLYMTFLFMALGFLTKGPVAVLIPFVVSLLFFLSVHQGKRWLRSVFDPIGLAIFAAVALPWYLLEYHAQGMGFIDGFFLKHNLDRFDTSMEQHGGGFSYYIVVMIIGLLPFTYLFVKSLRDMGEWFREASTRYLLLWFLFVWLFFSFSGTKLPHYVIYGYTAIFILSAGAFVRPWSRGWLLWPLILFMSILLLFPEIALAVRAQIHDRFARAVIGYVYNGFDLRYRLLTGAVLVALALLLFRRFSLRKTAVSVAFLFVIEINYALLPAYAAVMQQPVKDAALLAKARGWKVHLYRTHTPSFIFYYGDLVSEDRPRSGDIVFCRVTSLKDFSHYDTLFEENGYRLIRIK